MNAKCFIEILNQKINEFSLNIDDIISIITDGATVMKNVETLQQLCFAHVIQLAINDSLYKKNNSTSISKLYDIDSDLESNSESNVSDEEGEDFEYQNPIFNKIIPKIRWIVRLFRKSPTKNAILQKYVLQERKKGLQII